MVYTTISFVRESHRKRPEKPSAMSSWFSSFKAEDKAETGGFQFQAFVAPQVPSTLHSPGFPTQVQMKH
jgi:hypothetical protein